MQVKKVILSSAAALAIGLILCPDAGAQQRGRDRGPQSVEDDQQYERGRRGDGDRKENRRERRGDGDAQGARPGRRDTQSGDGERRGGRDGRGTRQAQDRGGRRDDRDGPRRAAPPPQGRDLRRDGDRRRTAPPAARRRYDRRAERRWHRDGPRARRDIYIPRRWAYRDRPHHRRLWNRRYGRVWWCGYSCRIGLLFGFTVWTTHTVLSYDSSYSFPVWESLEYNRTGETSLWESDWGYVEFTPTRTFKRRYGGYFRDCRNYLRVVVRSDGFERHYRGTACRNPNGSWWIVSSARVL